MSEKEQQNVEEQKKAAEGIEVQKDASSASDTTESSAEGAASTEAKASPALNEVFGFKKGMTAVYDEKGLRIPVTVLECKPWTITALKTQEKHGYEAVQIGFGAKKQKNAYKSELGESKKAKLDNAFKLKKEVRGSVPENCTLGAKVSLAQFPKGAKVQVTAKSKGRGFSGAMKRHGFAGGPASHGSGFHRRPGSIGMCTFPGRVMPGKKMPGQYGNVNVTISGLEIIEVNAEHNFLMVKGAVPGSMNSLVKVALR